MHNLQKMSLNLYTFLIIIAAVSLVEGFVPSTATQRQSLCILHFLTATPFFFATTEVDNDAPIPANPASASGPLDHEIIVDDECYMGKDGQLTECADFDPPKIPLTTVNLRDLLGQIDNKKKPKKIDFDAPAPYKPASASGPLDHEIIVDDECYMGKEGQLDECADFDPPKAGVSTYAILASQEDA